MSEPKQPGERVIVVVGDYLARNSPRMNELQTKRLVLRALRDDDPHVDDLELEELNRELDAYIRRDPWYRRLWRWFLWRGLR